MIKVIDQRPATQRAYVGDMVIYDGRMYLIVNTFNYDGARSVALLSLDDLEVKAAEDSIDDLLESFGKTKNLEIVPNEKISITLK